MHALLLALVLLAGPDNPVKVEGIGVQGRPRSMDKAKPISFDGFALPVARKTRPLPQTKAVVRVTKTQIRVGNGLPVIDATPFARNGVWDGDGALHKQLVAVRGPSEDVVVLAIEPAVSYQVAKKILFACNRAGFSRIAFAVRREGSAEVVALDLLELADPKERRAFVWDEPGPGETIVMGSLDPALIDASIRRHLEKIQDCYDRELAKHPNLTGTVVVNFRIDPDGSVGQAHFKSTTMENPPPSFESCVAERFKAIPFPKTKGGGIVNVNYPMLFKTSD